MNECVDLVLEASRLRDENAELRAEIERLQDLIWRNVDPMLVTKEDAAIVEEIGRLRVFEGK